MAEIIESPIASQAGHWYRKGTGAPAYTIIGKNGKERATTLRDARAENLVPSVTTVIQVMDKPGLNIWKINQAIMSALTLPKEDGESIDDYAKRVMADSKEQGIKAAERGTAIHAAIEQYIQNLPNDSQFARHSYNATLKISEWAGFARNDIDEVGNAERSFASSLGYGGKVDFSCPGFVADFKTTDKPLESIKTWDEHAIQLAAYRVGLGMPDARCAIIYVHVDGEAKLIELTDIELERGWDMFRAALELWKAAKKYNPAD